MPSKLIVKRTIILSEIEKIDINVWQVPKSKDRPEGKGHHLHIDKKEKGFKFVSIEETIKFILNKR